MKLYDTNAIMLMTEIPEDGVTIASVTLDELENIKSRRFYTDEQKFKARRGVNLLYNADEDKVTVLPSAGDPRANSPDERICLTALENGAVLVTNDKAMTLLASHVYDLDVIPYCEDSNEYLGYRLVEKGEPFPEDALEGEYIIHLDGEDVLGIFVKRDNQFFRIEGEGMCFGTLYLGDIVPLDPLQVCAFDSIMKNQVTMLRGEAGTGKTLLALAYGLHAVGKGEISKIAFFTNACRVKDTDDIGALPGDKDEKLMDTSVGNMLGTKLGDKDIVYALIQQGVLEIYPMNFIRGMSVPEGTLLILDEAQNTSIPLMKLALQRVEDGAKVIICGDTEQQLDKVQFSSTLNGMRRASEVLRGWREYGELTLNTVHRSELCELIQQM